MFAPVLGALLFVGTSAAAAPQTQPAAPRPAAPAAPAPQAAAPAAAPAPLPFPADARIGFLDMQGVVNNSRLGKTGQEQVKQLSDKRGTEIQTKNKQLQTLQQEVQTGSAVLSAGVLAQKNAEIDKLTRELQFMNEQAQADVQALTDQLLQDFGAKVMPIVEQIRSERGLWVVFSFGDSVAAVNPALDVTAEVVKRLDASK